ncbi:metal-dependent transcriptional regulator [Halomontanus rarus]|uniref:metal-dependent transcriptional regulator n=1 Tax=Halomontanus rarus TaxID=3034020 RepID=UPI0023E75FA1|nr:metal-dependent transcriptional regulator [Halovivax sp. TS33]
MASTTRDSGADRSLENRRSISPAEGWYLTTVYWLGVDADGTVRMGALAERLDVSPSSVTEMAATLSDGPLLSYQRYDGVELTRRGRAVAESLARRQCVVTAYFDQLLSYSIDPYTAYRIGYVLPTDGISRLERAIEQPRMDACQRVHEGSEECLLGSDARVRLPA